MHTGQAIRLLRLAKGYSQENMAEMLHLSTKTYGLLERNGFDAHDVKLPKIAEILHCSVADILTFDEKWMQVFNPQDVDAQKTNGGGGGKKSMMSLC